MIISLKNKILASVILTILSLFTLNGQSLSLHPVRRGGKFGYANEQGKMVITPKFTIAMEFGEGLAYVSEGADRHGSWKHGFIDEKGRWVVMLDGKSFRPSTTEGEVRHDQTVFVSGFVELPSFNSTGGGDFATSSVWMNRHQMMELVDRYGRETPIRPTSGIFYSRLTSEGDYILGIYQKANNTKGPNGTFAFRANDSYPVTSTQPGEENSWFGSFGTMRYTGNTYLVYTDVNNEVRYFDEVTVVERNDGWTGFLAKSISGPYMLYTKEITPADEESYATVGDFMRTHSDYFVKSSSEEKGGMQEFMSRRLMNFQSMSQMEEYYLADGKKVRKDMIPVCKIMEGAALSEVRIAGNYGTLMITDYVETERVAWLWDFTTNTKRKVRMPLTIDGRGRAGNDGESGSDGAAGRPKLTYREGNVTKTEAGTCGEAGGNGKDGERGGDGANLLVIIDNNIPQNMITILTEGGKGGRGGAGGKGGIHGNGSSCSGRAKDGKQGKDGADGNPGTVKKLLCQ